MIVERTAEAQAPSHIVEYVDVVVRAAECILAGSLSVDGYVIQRVHAARAVGRKGAVDDEAALIVVRVDEVILVVKTRDVADR